MSFGSGGGRRGLLVVGVILLLAVFALQLALSARRESQTFDEGNHIFAGYTYWTRADFGINPEHPPLVKLLATIPLLRLPLRVPTIQDRHFKLEAFVGGKDFVFGNDANRIVFRARMAAAALSLLLALLAFAMAREMFGTGAAFLALVLLVFDPNILAHGALVTTDMGVASFLFAAVYAFYRYVQRPSLARLGLVGVAAGLALASKHSGLLVFPILILLAISEVIRGRRTDQEGAELGPTAPGRGRQALRLTGALVAVGLMAVAILWSSYGFRYATRPSGLKMNPPFSDFAAQLQRPADRRVVMALSHWHVLPEAYLYGLVDVRGNADYSFSYIFGRIYPHGQWFYFPAIVAIKTTLGLLLLLLGVPVVLVMRCKFRWREALFLAIPPSLYFLAAVGTGMNRGVRHILMIYPFLMILAAAAAWMLVQRSRRWGYVVAALVVFHIASSVRAFPTYIAYANELWGGPANTYKYFTDSSVDWGQQLKSTANYLEQRGIRECWFASYVGEVVNTRYYGVPCKLLPTNAICLSGPLAYVPSKIEGTVLVSTSLISGFEFGDGELNPYRQFQAVPPKAMIEYGIFVYEGSFDISGVAALNHAARAWQLDGDKHFQEALPEAQAAVALEPRLAFTHACLGDAFWGLERREEARQAYRDALKAAQTVQPEYQRPWISYLQGQLAAP